MKINLTPFQLKVLKEVLKIPPGEVKSYTWLAKKVGSPGAVRAVGTVLRKNPFPVIIPCHRVDCWHTILADVASGRYHIGLPILIHCDRILKADLVVWRKAYLCESPAVIPFISSPVVATSGRTGFALNIYAVLGFICFLAVTDGR